MTFILLSARYPYSSDALQCFIFGWLDTTTRFDDTCYGFNFTQLVCLLEIVETISTADTKPKTRSTPCIKKQTAWGVYCCVLLLFLPFCHFILEYINMIHKPSIKHHTWYVPTPLQCNILLYYFDCTPFG